MTTDFDEWLEDADIEYREELDDLIEVIETGKSSTSLEADKDGDILRIRRHGYNKWLALVSEKAKRAFFAHIRDLDVIDPDDPDEG